MTNKSVLLNNKLLVSVWGIFHAVILSAFLIILFLNRGLKIDADLFHMLPSSTLDRAMALADEKLSVNTSKNVFLLAGHEDFKKAKEAAETAYERLSGSQNFSSLTLYTGGADLNSIEEFIHPYRWSLLNEETIELLSSPEGTEEFAAESIATAYNSFNLSSLEHLDEDPFAFDEVIVRDYLASVQAASTSMTPKDGVLASFHEGMWYVMIRGVLTPKGTSLASKTNGPAVIYEACRPLEKDGVRFVYAGISFHSYKSSTSAIKEVSDISMIAISVVIIMLIFVFRNPTPLIASLISICVSIATGLGATLIIFGEIHITALVLGTSLIGSCIDYSLHYFVNWKAHTGLRSTARIRMHLFKGLSLSLISTEICYILLLFAPFGLLKQMGIFSSVGILSSFLTVICIYPLFPLPHEEHRKLPVLKFFRLSPLRNIKHSGVIFSSALILILGTIIALDFKNLDIKNDMYRLYTMEGRVKEDSQLSTQITGYNPQGWFIVHGNSQEELLQNEEFICSELDKIQKGGYLATCKFIPSLKKQNRSAEAAKNLLPFAQDQFEILGFDEEAYSDFNANVETWKNAHVVSLSELPPSLASIVSMLWLGDIDGTYYSIVLPVRLLYEDDYHRIAEQSGSACFENKMSDLATGLDKLTQRAALLFCIAYVIIIFVLKHFYKWKQVFKIASIPLICVMFIVSVFMLLGEKVEFFSFTGMILVFGLGLDYIIYMIENLKRQKNRDNLTSRIEPFAIFLSFLTTAISFGALAFSTFVPVHTMGLTIFLGLVAAFICTVF